MAAIPRIVLDDRDPGGVPSDPAMTLGGSTVNGPLLWAGTGSSADVDSVEPTDYVPHRCNSDIGLPTTSMPNLPLAMGMGEHGDSGDKLGVYCSPRTTRRSVDLDVGSRDPAARAEYEWLAEDKTSSLRVLSAGSRVGSAVSLNSVCTAHSVGLLSNDSSDEYQDASLTEGSVGGAGGLSGTQGDREKAGQLRRLQSYPEAEDKSGGPDPSVTPRTSHSLCNLKAAQGQASTLQGDGRGQGQGQNRGQLTPEKLCLLPSDLDECDDGMLPPGDGGERVEGQVVGKEKAVGRDEESAKAHMVSYGKGSSSMREGRIRRWLQDMDTASE